jgi:hypothetical protein
MEIPKLSMRDVAQAWRDRGWDEKVAKILETSARAAPAKHADSIGYALGAIVSTGGERALDVLARDFSKYLKSAGIAIDALGDRAKLAAAHRNWRENFDARRRTDDAGVREASEAWMVVHDHVVKELRWTFLGKGRKMLEVGEGVELAAFQHVAERAAAASKPKSLAAKLTDVGASVAEGIELAAVRDIAEDAANVPRFSRPSARVVQKSAALLLIGLFLAYRHAKGRRRAEAGSVAGRKETAFSKIIRAFERLLAARRTQKKKKRASGTAGVTAGVRRSTRIRVGSTTR